MMRLLGWLLLLLAVAGNAPASAHAWELYKSPDERFEVELPARPTVSQHVDGKGRKVLQLKAKNPEGGTYGVAATESTDDRPAEEILQSVQDSVLRGFAGSEVLSAESVTQGSWHGRAVAMRIQGGELIYQARIYWVPPRLYQVIVISEPNRAANPATTRFMDSFRLLKD